MKTVYNFGEALQKLREKSGLTQNQLASRLGVKNSTVSKYETSAAPPPALMVRKIATEFGVSCDFLLGLEPSGTVSLHGLDKEQSAAVSELAEALRARNMSVKNKIPAERYEVLDRVTACLMKK